MKVKWKTCPYDNPVGFNITFKEDGGEHLKCEVRFKIKISFIQDERE